MGFFLSILFIIAFLFLIYARHRLLPKIWDWVLSAREKKGLETESLRKFQEGDMSHVVEELNNGFGWIQNRKLRRSIQIVIPHLVLYLFVFAFTFLALYRHSSIVDISPKVYHIIFLGMVIIEFPLVSVFWELARRKAERKKHKDNSKHERELDH
ncbi:MAG: hypothetical protein ABR913_08215 [Sedimentisphaerales bacterium]